MWRRQGDGEVYLYAPYHQAADFCDRPGYHCNYDYGNSVARGSWRFERDMWHSIEQQIRLNTPGKLDGHLKLYGNNSYDN